MSEITKSIIRKYQCIDELDYKDRIKEIILKEFPTIEYKDNYDIDSFTRNKILLTKIVEGNLMLEEHDAYDILYNKYTKMLLHDYINILSKNHFCSVFLSVGEEKRLVFTIDFYSVLCYFDTNNILFEFYQPDFSHQPYGSIPVLNLYVNFIKEDSYKNFIDWMSQAFIKAMKTEIFEFEIKDEK